MKVIFLTLNNFEATGGYVVTKKHQEILVSIFGSDNVKCLFINPASKGILLSKVLSRLFNGFYYFLTKKDSKSIKKVIHDYNPSVIFIDCSCLGIFARDIKREFPTIILFTFFHNVESIFDKEMFRVTKNPKHLYQMLISYQNEKFACKYSDFILSLNERDGQKIKELYHREPDYYDPVSLIDDFDISYYTQHIKSKLQVLIVASYFPANIHGIDWIVKNVLPFVDIELTILGSGMNNLINVYKGIPNLKILGFVDDLRMYYANADFMLIPIFTGSGMKVKTAEALKYGKFIIAGPEAIVGYDITEKEASVCSTADEFINAINSFKRSANFNGFNKSSRDLYLEKYSYDASMKLYNNIFYRFKNNELD